jgi:hypothetical protein
MIVAGCALALPLAAGTASAAFDADGDAAASVEDTSSGSVEGSVSSTDAEGSTASSVGDGVVKTGEDGARVEACAAKSRPCAAVRGSGLPTVAKEQLVELDTIDAEAFAKASKDGASVTGSTTAQREDASASAELSTDGGSLQADTPLGSGSGHVTIDGTIQADGMPGNH